MFSGCVKADSILSSCCKKLETFFWAMWKKFSEPLEIRKKFSKSD